MSNNKVVRLLMYFSYHDLSGVNLYIILFAFTFTFCLLATILINEFKTKNLLATKKKHYFMSTLSAKD